MKPSFVNSMKPEPDTTKVRAFVEIFVRFTRQKNHSSYNFGKIDILIHFDWNFPALHESLIPTIPTDSKFRATHKKLNKLQKFQVSCQPNIQ
jgi:hypothetical protein